MSTAAGTGSTPPGDIASPVAKRKPDSDAAPLVTRLRSPFLPLLIWLAIQIAAVALAAGRIPLAANHPRPAEWIAPYLLLAIQLAGSAALFPLLLRDWRTAVLVIAVAPPLQVLAASIAMLPIAQIAPAGGYVLLWIITLAVWRVTLCSVRAQLIGVAIASLLATGGGILWYVATEFGVTPPTTEAAANGTFGPLVATLAAIPVGELPHTLLLGTAALLLLGGVGAFGVKWLAHRKMPKSLTVVSEN